MCGCLSCTWVQIMSEIHHREMSAESGRKCQRGTVESGWQSIAEG